MRRVVITGLGAITPYGIGVDAFWNNCLSQTRCVKPIPEAWYLYSNNYSCKVWIPLPEIDFKKYNIKSPERRHYDPVSLISIIAAQEALLASNLEIESRNKKNNTLQISNINPEKIGVYIGTGIGASKSSLDLSKTHWFNAIKDEIVGLSNSSNMLISKLDIPDRYNPFAIPRSMVNAPSAAIGIKFGIEGPVNNISAACASGTIAIGKAFREIATGTIDLAVSGGSEYNLDNTGGIFKGFDVANTLANGTQHADKVNRPFDKDRTGFVMSQGGSGMVVLEEYQHAINRRAPIIAEVLSFGETFDACNIMQIDAQGKNIRRLMNLVLNQVKMKPLDVNYINAHGTGTIVNDNVEGSAINDIFGGSVLVNSTKSLVGHSIGASGALEFIISALSIKNQTTHVSANIDNSEYDLNFVLSEGKMNIATAYTETFAFGGHNAAILLAGI